MYGARRAHATDLPSTFQPLTPIVVTVGVKVQIFHGKFRVVEIDEHVRVCVAIAKGLCAMKNSSQQFKSRGLCEKN